MLEEDATTLDYVWNFKDIPAEQLRNDLTIGLVSIAFIAIILATVFGNVIVIVAILTYRQLKKQQSNLFILNLAFADISVVVTVMIWSTVAFMLDMGKDTDHPWVFTTVSHINVMLCLKIFLNVKPLNQENMFIRKLNY